MKSITVYYPEFKTVQLGANELNREKRTLIVGAGLAGLCCATELQKKGITCSIYESDNCVGGRVKTDLVDGFRLDRGFQVLLDSYPEARQALDFGRLNLGSFEPGALVRYQGRFSRFVDPWRRPLSFFSTLVSPLATFSDKIRMARLRHSLFRIGDKELKKSNQSTQEYLRDFGFSSKVIDHFFRPFFGGVFLESDLATSSAKFKYLFRMFSSGLATLPANGMQAIANQLAEGLPNETINFESRVDALTDQGLLLANGQEVAGDAIVLATPAHVTAKLLDESLRHESRQPESQQVGCIYFSADRSPLNSKTLVVNGEGSGPINTVCVPSDICSTYAPAGKALVSVSVLANHLHNDSEVTVSAVRDQLEDWFGDSVKEWSHLKSYRISHALPSQTPDRLTLDMPIKRDSRIYVCGDHTGIASIQGAMESGRLAAEAISSQS